MLVGLLVLAVLGVGGWMAKSAFPRLLGAIDGLREDAKEERSAAATERRDMLKAFREELAAERVSNSSAIAEDRQLRAHLAGDIRDEIARVHERVDGIATSLATCAECQTGTAARLAQRAEELTPHEPH